MKKISKSDNGLIIGQTIEFKEWREECSAPQINWSVIIPQCVQKRLDHCMAEMEQAIEEDKLIKVDAYTIFYHTKNGINHFSIPAQDVMLEILTYKNIGTEELQTFEPLALQQIIKAVEDYWAEDNRRYVLDVLHEFFIISAERRKAF